jgi:hypothetical protein
MDELTGFHGTVGIVAGVALDWAVHPSSLHGAGQGSSV